MPTLSHLPSLPPLHPLHPYLLLLYLLLSLSPFFLLLLLPTLSALSLALLQLYSLALMPLDFFLLPLLGDPSSRLSRMLVAGGVAFPQLAGCLVAQIRLLQETMKEWEGEGWYTGVMAAFWVLDTVGFGAGFGLWIRECLRQARKMQKEPAAPRPAVVEGEEEERAGLLQLVEGDEGSSK